MISRSNTIAVALNPNHPAQLPQHYLQPRAPRLWHLISEGLDRMGHEPQRIPDPARFVDETREVSIGLQI
jgi:hypothetical protein